MRSDKFLDLFYSPRGTGAYFSRFERSAGISKLTNFL